MNERVQAGVVQLGIAGLMILAWYTGAWQAIVDELVAGVTGRGTRRFAVAAAPAVPAAPAPVPAAGIGGGGAWAR